MKQFRKYPATQQSIKASQIFKVSSGFEEGDCESGPCVSEAIAFVEANDTNEAEWWANETYRDDHSYIGSYAMLATDAEIESERNSDPDFEIYKFSDVLPSEESLDIHRKPRYLVWFDGDKKLFDNLDEAEDYYALVIDSDEFDEFVELRNYDTGKVLKSIEK